MLINRSVWNNFVALICILSLSVTAGGCADDLHSAGTSLSECDMVALPFSIEAPAMTRADALPHENRMREVYLLFFDGTESESDSRWLGSVKAAVSDGTSSLKFRVPVYLKKDTDYRILALANADGFVPQGFATYMSYLNSFKPAAGEPGLTMPEVKSKIQLQSRSYLVYDPEDDGNFLLPMTGEAATADNEAPLLHISSGAGGYEMSRALVFRRSVARIDIDIANNAERSIVLERAAVCNSRASLRPFLPTDVLDEIGGVGTFGSLFGSLYAFPNVSEVNEAGDSLSTGVIIKGYYVDNGVQDTELCYYRVNIGNLGNPQTIWPNTRYRITVESVKGRGCATAEEAYRSSECLVELSDDTGWNESGLGYAMDAAGNFLAVSIPKISFPAATESPVRTFVFASEKVNEWHFETSAEWLSITKGENYLDINTSDENSTDEERTTVVKVIGDVAGSTEPLVVEIAVRQSAGSGVVDWELPPVALVPVGAKYDPVSGALVADHVKVFHQKNNDGTWTRRIEIDGFAPEVFNSFIDVPLSVHIDPESTDVEAVSIADTFEWPLEGCVSSEKSQDLRFYTWESFKTGKEPAKPASVSGQLKKDDMLYVSVGAMAPDDPKIERTITLGLNNEGGIIYDVCVKPRPVIIDDVILEINGKYIMVCDRNVQGPSIDDKEGWSELGYRPQAWHYCNQSNMAIPNKLKKSGTKAYEDEHESFLGLYVNRPYTSQYFYTNTIDSWANRYQSNYCQTSPFYSSSSIHQWKCPTINEAENFVSKIKVSKLRLFFVSEFNAHIKDQGIKCEVCCYLPQVMVKQEGGYVPGLNRGEPSDKNLLPYILSSGNATSGYGAYFYVEGKNIDQKIVFKPEKSISEQDKCWLLRLVRELSEAEVQDYKDNYLGYGGGECPLKPCKPDTHPYDQPYPQQ